MFHYFQWKVEKKGWITLLIHDFIGIQISYVWRKSEWEFYLFPVYDENKRTVQYFAFDTLEQKQIFEQFLKVNGIWSNTAFQLAQTPSEELSNAVKNMDVKFFQSIPWIWPKWAKKILLELKDSLNANELSSLDVDQKLFKDIVYEIFRVESYYRTELSILNLKLFKKIEEHKAKLKKLSK